MNNYKDLVLKNDLIVNKITYKGKATIIDTNLGKFVIKENKNFKIYNYLLSRGFDYFPKIVDYNDSSIMFEYIESIEYDKNEKAKDYLKLLSLLHTKTCYYIEVSDDDIKKTYEDVNKRISDNYMFYENLINMIDSKEYMSPVEYYISKNIGIILSAFNYCFERLNNWYENNKNNNKKRVVTLLNNIDINNLVKSIDKSYYISFNDTKVNNPIYDLISFYDKYWYDFDFTSLLMYYEKVFPLLDEEKSLLYIIISIPGTFSIDYYTNNFSNIKTVIDKVYNTLKVLEPKEEKDTEAHQ